MSKRRIRVSREQFDRLMENLRTTPEQVVGEHLTDDEFIEYSLKTLDAGEMRRIEVHVASCPDCSAELKRVMSGSEAWRGAQGKERLEELRRRIFAPSRLDQLSAFLKPIRVPILTKVFHAHEDLASARSSDGIFGALVEAEANGDVTVRFDSRALELEGKVIRVFIGERHWDATFHKITAHALLAKVTIPSSEIPDEAVIRSEMLD